MVEGQGQALSGTRKERNHMMEQGYEDSLPSAETLSTTVPVTRKWLLLGMRPLMSLYVLYASDWEIPCKPISRPTIISANLPEPLVAVFAR